MYFPTLNIMKKYKVDEFLIRKLDIWLATRRKAVRKFLSPLQFSLDTDIDEDLSIDLFFICSEKDLELLKFRTIVKCPNCDRIIGVYEEPTKIPSSIYCDECNFNIKVNQDIVETYFELTQLPMEQVINRDSIVFREGDDGSGKAFGLRVEQIEKSKSDMARRLFGKYNERFRNS
jgi:hypothetical protein